MYKLTCHWCGKQMTRADATPLCDKYVCTECYESIFHAIEDYIAIVCSECADEIYGSEPLYCSSCYKDAREVKCAGCNDFISNDEVYCKACMEEALATIKKEGGDNQV